MIFDRTGRLFSAEANKLEFVLAFVLAAGV